MNEIRHQNYNDNIREIWKISVEQKERFINLIITLSVAAIGFSAIHILNKPFKLEDFLLASANFCWCLVVVNSFRTLEKLHDMVVRNGFINKKKRDFDFLNKGIDRKQFDKDLKSHNILDEQIIKELKSIKCIFLLGIGFSIIWILTDKLIHTLEQTSVSL